MTEFLSRFSFSLEHIRGKDNTVADLLSRPNDETNVLNLTINLINISNDNLRKEQARDQTLLTLKNSNIKLAMTKDNIAVDTMHGKNRVILPKCFRYPEFERLHNISHPGATPTIRLISDRYIWPRMKSDIREWCRRCQRCQIAKITRYTKAPLGEIQTNGRFRTVHIDIVGQLPVNNNKKYILTMIDRGIS